MRKRLIALALSVVGVCGVTACGTQCGPGTQEFNGTCVSNNQGGFDRDDDDYEEDDD